jgi:hypothetical protein
MDLWKFLWWWSKYLISQLAQGDKPGTSRNIPHVSAVSGNGGLDDHANSQRANFIFNVYAALTTGLHSTLLSKTPKFREAEKKWGFAAGGFAARRKSPTPSHHPRPAKWQKPARNEARRGGEMAGGGEGI